MFKWDRAYTLSNTFKTTIFFFIKCPVPSQDKGHYSSFLCVLHFGVVFLLCRSSLIFDTLPSVFVCNPDLFFSLSIYEFQTAVYNCCLYTTPKRTKTSKWVYSIFLIALLYNRSVNIISYLYILVHILLPWYALFSLI